MLRTTSHLGVVSFFPSFSPDREGSEGARARIALVLSRGLFHWPAQKPGGPAALQSHTVLVSQYMICPKRGTERGTRSAHGRAGTRFIVRSRRRKLTVISSDGPGTYTAQLRVNLLELLALCDDFGVCAACRIHGTQRRCRHRRHRCGGEIKARVERQKREHDKLAKFAK